MSENLFAYTATNSGYSEGTAGAINGERAAVATALSAVKNNDLIILSLMVTGFL